MRAVWKFGVRIEAAHTVFEMPRDARLVHVAPLTPRGDEIVLLWFEVDLDAPRDIRTFRIFGTGDPAIRDDYQYCGTTQQARWVWHVYERIG